MKMAGAVRTGGKGSMRRCKSLFHLSTCSFIHYSFIGSGLGVGKWGFVLYCVDVVQFVHLGFFSLGTWLRFFVFFGELVCATERRRLFTKQPQLMTRGFKAH